MPADCPFESFRDQLRGPDTVARLRAGLIGEGVEITTPFGRQRLVYADYTASGRALRQVEDFVATQVLPFYANSHTEASFCGAHTTGLREGARRFIASEMNCGDACSVIFTGSGATAAVNRLVALSGLSGAVRENGTQPVVFIGPYEHHSNILPWRESGAKVVEIDEAPAGGPDLAALESALRAHAGAPLKIGSFSAASNVTGILSDVVAVTRLLKAHGALAFWDYAGGGPYLPMDMHPAQGAEIDAIFLSPHKFPGGPGASGVLAIRHAAIRATRPTWPGGGSVAYVSPWAHDYLASVVEREEAGTPNIIGDIRAGLVFALKAAIGLEHIETRDQALLERALKRWKNNPQIVVLAEEKPNRLPIISFLVRDPSGGFVHHEAFTRALSERAGIQVRGGCVCAGPYGHRLLGVDRTRSEEIRAAVLAGQESRKPGWVRLNFGYLMDDATVDYIIDTVDRLARDFPAASPAASYQHEESPAIV